MLLCVCFMFGKLRTPGVVTTTSHRHVLIALSGQRWWLIVIDEKSTADEVDMPITGLIQAMVNRHRLHVRSIFALYVSVNITEIRRRVRDVGPAGPVINGLG